MSSRIVAITTFAVFFIVRLAESQPPPLQTLRNTAIILPAADLTTNGLAGLTNTAPQLTVSAVAATSAQGGSVALVNTQAWVNRYASPIGYNSFGAAVAADRAGNVLVTGSAATPATGFDILTIKYAPDGTPLWTNRYDGPLSGYDFGSGVGVDAGNNVYVAGESAGIDMENAAVLIKYSSAGAALWTNRYENIPNTNANPPVLAVDSSGNSFVLVTAYGPAPMAFITLKYDASGHPAWTNIYHGPAGGPDYPLAMALDPAGNVFITGGTQETNPPGEHWATIKYAANGTPLWTNKYGSSVVDQPAAITSDRTGNAIVTGDSLDGISHTYVTIKYAGTGAALWTNILTGPNYQGGEVPRVVADVANNVFLLGGSPDALGSGNVDLTSIKLTGDGLPVWTNEFQDFNIANSEPAGTAVDDAGNYYLACHSTGPGLTNVDYVTIKYAAAGAALWTNRYDGPGQGADYPQAITTDGAGNAYVTGQSTGMGGELDFGTVKYSDNLVYTPPADFAGMDTFGITVVDQFGNSATGLVTVTVLPLTLQFNTAAANLRRTAQGVQLEVDGASGTNAVVLLGSTNLMTWQPVATNPPVLGSVRFLDAGATNLARRFYRAMQQ